MSPRQRDTILAMLRKGHFVSVACLQAGVGRSRFYELLQEYPVLAQQVAAAKAEAEDVCLSAIIADPSWQARAWVLERRHAKRWAKKQPDVVIAPQRDAGGLKLPDDPAEQAVILRALADQAERKAKK